MPNDPKMFATRAAAALTLSALLTACATTPPDPVLLRPAEEALALAEQAGAPDHAPLELEEAQGYYENATEALAAEELGAVARYVELAEVQARLAIVRSQGAQARETLAEKRADYEDLRAEMRAIFGDEIQLEDTP